MNCAKCDGLMMNEKIQDYAGGIWFWGWRCVFCGKITDELIEKNRIMPPAPHKELKRVSYKRRWRKKVLA